jgi:hypothetical protein
VNVTDQLQKICIAVAKNGFVAALEEMTHHSVTAVIEELAERPGSSRFVVSLGCQLGCQGGCENRGAEEPSAPFGVSSMEIMSFLIRRTVHAYLAGSSCYRKGSAVSIVIPRDPTLIVCRSGEAACRTCPAMIHGWTTLECMRAGVSAIIGEWPKPWILTFEIGILERVNLTDDLVDRAHFTGRS